MNADMAAPPARDGLLPGFGQLARKELLEAARSRRMAIFLVLMTVVMALVPVIGYLRIDVLNDGARHRIAGDDMEGMMAAWAGIVGYLGSLLVIAATVDAVSSERASGITGWIVTKPVSRAAYLTAKVAMHTLTACTVIVIVPGVLWLFLTVMMFEDVPMARILLAALILCIEMLFLSTVTVALGVPFRSVVWVAVISLGVWFIPTIAPVVAVLEWAPYVLPSYLPIAAIAAIIGEEGSLAVSVPVASLAIAAVVFGAALTMFEGQEL